MGFNRRVTEDMMNPMKVRKSPLERVLDNLSVIAETLVHTGIAADKETKKWDTKRRTIEIAKLDREAQKMGKTYFPSDFGDPYKNPDDFIAYKSTIMNDANMYRFGKDYQPEYNILSPEAQSDVFTYGTGETSGPIDRTPNRIAMNDLINFDAWLLGGSGAGAEVAKRHNWKGLLEDFDHDLGGYVLDREDFRDLEEKGLITTGATENNGLYILSQEERDKVANNYEMWRLGFTNTNSETLVSMSDISKIVQDENLRDLQKTTAVRTNYAREYNFIQNFADFMEDPDYKVAILDSDGLNVKEYNFGIAIDPDNVSKKYPKGKPYEVKVDRDDFISKPKWSNIYNFIYSGMNTEQSINHYLANPELRDDIRINAPKVHHYIGAKINAFSTIQSKYDQIGLDQTRTEYLNHSNIMADGRDVVLDDLRRIGNGILFDKQKNSNLSPQQEDQLLDELIQLEQLYLNPDSNHYNESVARFLQMSYGLGQERPGQSLLNLLTEVER